MIHCVFFHGFNGDFGMVLMVVFYGDFRMVLMVVLW